MNTDRLRLVALGKEPADLLLKNCRVVDVITETTYEANVAICGAAIAGVGDYTAGIKVVDLQGAYVCPGFVNAHVHVESSMASPEDYIREELRWGTTTVITDPHEIANVAGGEGIRYMLQAGRHMPINYYVELPSCVPATDFEHSGCVMNAADMAELMDLPGVLGMGEMMNFPGVIYSDPKVIAKLDLFHAKNRVIDGHAPCATGKELQAYLASGIDTDHESISYEEAKEKLRFGQAVLVRQGGASRNLTAIIKGVLEDGIDVSMMAFCTDDKHLEDVAKEGTIRNCVRMAIELGMKPERAIRIASINAARIYGLRHLGAVAPGYQADLVAFDNLNNLQPVLVLHKGQDANALAQDERKLIPSESLVGSVNIAPVYSGDFAPERFCADQEYSVIEMLPGEIFTEVSTIKGEVVSAALAKGELCMIAVVERHHGTGNIGLGLLRGYGLHNGAAATTIAHDSHNIIVAGTNAEDMYRAVQEIEAMQGGYVLVQQGQVVDSLKLDIAGLMTTMPSGELIQRIEVMGTKARAMGVAAGVDPFISLSFMALPDLPKIRITDMGVFDVSRYCLYDSAMQPPKH